MREYSSKVDELVKEKLEAQNELKNKEKEEKEMVAQQVVLKFCGSFFFFLRKLNVYKKFWGFTLCRICMLSCCLLCLHRREWVEVSRHHKCHCQWAGWGCPPWQRLECHQWATDHFGMLDRKLQLLHS